MMSLKIFDMETVRPMYKQFIEPTKRHADVILPHGANGPAMDKITTKGGQPDWRTE
jgi:uridine kinase